MSQRRSLLFKKPTGGVFAFNNALNNVGTTLEKVTFTKDGSINDTWSWAGWVKSTDINNNKQLIGSSANANVYVRINDANSRVIIRTVNNYYFTGFSFSNDTYYFIAVSVSALGCRVWVDDVESSAGTLTIDSIAAANNFDQLYRAGTTSTNQTMDELGLWYGYALTDADVTYLYNGGDGNSCLDISPGNLHYNYKFDETTGSTATDSSAAGNDGTLVSFVTDDSQWVAH